MRPPSEPQTIDQIPRHTVFLFPRKPVAWAVCNHCLLFLNDLYLNQWASFPKNILRPGKIKCTPMESHAKPLYSETTQATASLSVNREGEPPALCCRRDERWFGGASPVREMTQSLGERRRASLQTAKSTRPAGARRLGPLQKPNFRGAERAQQRVWVDIARQEALFWLLLRLGVLKVPSPHKKKNRETGQERAHSL